MSEIWNNKKKGVLHKLMLQKGNICGKISIYGVKIYNLKTYSFFL